MEVEIADGVRALDAAAWDALTDGSPLLSHAFLSAFEHAGCVDAASGWQPCPLLVRDGSRLLGAMPLYAKSHSYGEYVFDWAWARAFERHGLDYYPKLIAAVPFTPITGARLLTRDAEVGALMVRALDGFMRQQQLSSAHVLFADDPDARLLQQQGWLRRDGVQFRWENPDFADFSEFLATLTHDKRKKIRQERSKVAAAGVSVKRLTGDAIRPADWAFFYRCYVHTYRLHHSTPYLNEAFFQLLGQRLPQHLLLVVAERAGEPIAAALNLYGRRNDGSTCLYGRYWGALQHVPGLHFELCYYQAQEFCIERGIRYFEGGAQGEHKLARGFRPRPTCSFHRIAHADFAQAIERAVQGEAQDMQLYQDELERRAPFRQL